MTKSLNTSYPYIADILMTTYIAPMCNNQGIDTIELITHYESFVKMAFEMGLTIKPMPKNNKIFEKIENEFKADTTKRLKVEAFKPIVERIDLPKVKGHDKDLYISIVRNIPTLFDVATHHKKAKNSFCKIVFAGLHQPTKNISSNGIKIISKFLKRKTFKLHRIDIAIDTVDHRSITYKRKESFKDDLMPHSKHGVISKGSSLYVNKLEHLRLDTVLYYDKYLKQLNQQKKEIIGNEYQGWKRLEVVITFDVTKRESKGFSHYIESLDFADDLCSVHEFAGLAGIKSYDQTYLNYQINSILDNRFMNNQKSKKQFNSVESLERFKQSDFISYALAI